jgi:hypothetical protein
MVQMAPPSGPAMPPSRTPVTGDPMQKLLAMKANQGQPPGQVPPIPPQQLQQTGQMPPAMPPQPIPDEQQNFNQSLKKVGPIITAQLADRAIGSELKQEVENEERINELAQLRNKQIQDEVLQRMAMFGPQGSPMTPQNRTFQNLGEVAIDPTGMVAAQSGGLIALAGGGGFSGQVPGIGHGMEDNVYMPIVERAAGEQVGTLAVSPDEYVVDAHTMSALGNGSADAGAEVMDQAVKNIRHQAYGTDEQPNELSGLAALQPLIERV